MDSSYFEFKLTPKEITKIKRLKTMHRKKHPNCSVSYTFTPTGISYAVKATFGCGKAHDISDYGSW